MRIFHDENVYDAALARIRYIMERFDVVVPFSGGKDSTAVLGLVTLVAKDMGRLPVKVKFLDQEAEWQVAIDYIRRVADRPEVDMRWYQIPFKITSSHSKDQLFMHCWDPALNDDTWMRPKEPDSIHENDLVDRSGKPIDTLFKSVLTGIQRQHYDPGTVFIGGVRAEESPARMMSLTQHPVFDGLTWGKEVGQPGEHKYVMYPIYDWSYKDIWKAIYDHDWEYCSLYDTQYAYGMPALKMRLSSLCHENACKSLSQLHQFERETWEKMVVRIKGAATSQNMDYVTVPKELPYMFRDWREYRDYLVDNLLEEPGRSQMAGKFAGLDTKYVDSGKLDEDMTDGLMQMCVQTVLRNDYYYVALENFVASLGFGRHLKPEAKVVKRA